MTPASRRAALRAVATLTGPEVSPAPTATPPALGDNLRAASMFDYSGLDPAAADTLRGAAAAIRETLHGSVIDIGSRLIGAKELLDHGKFSDWAEAEIGLSVRSAENYMNAARFLAGKAKCVSLLPQGALYALAAPSTPPAVVADVLAEIERGAVPKVADIRERIAGVTKAQRAAAAIKTAEQIKREKENDKRRRAAQAERDRKEKAEDDAREANRTAKASAVARFLTDHLGTDDIKELAWLMSYASWWEVEKALALTRTAAGNVVPLHAEPIEIDGDVAEVAA